MSTGNISWGIKAAGAYGRQLYHFHVPIILKFGSLNLLVTSGPVQACNGIALHLKRLEAILQVLTVPNIRIVFWSVTPCNLVYMS